MDFFQKKPREAHRDFSLTCVGCEYAGKCQHEKGEPCLKLEVDEDFLDRRMAELGLSPATA